MVSSTVLSKYCKIQRNSKIQLFTNPEILKHWPSAWFCWVERKPPYFTAGPPKNKCNFTDQKILALLLWQCNIKGIRWQISQQSLMATWTQLCLLLEDSNKHRPFGDKSLFSLGFSMGFLYWCYCCHLALTQITSDHLWQNITSPPVNKYKHRPQFNIQISFTLLFHHMVPTLLTSAVLVCISRRFLSYCK